MDKVTDSKHKHFPSIYRKIRWSFGLMTFAMFSLFWSLIYIAENQIEKISLNHWLDTEVYRYNQDYKVYGDKTVLPNTNEFKTYWSEQNIPHWLNAYTSPGVYEELRGEEDKHFIVSTHPSGKGLMYVVFQDDADDYLDEYEEHLHDYILILGLLIGLLMTIYSLYFIRTLSKPLTIIEQKIAQMSPDDPPFDVDTKFVETRNIEQTLLDSKNDINGFFQREKEFSHFASHELRTPITVVKGSAELLAKIPDQHPVAVNAVKRLQQASDEMQVLTETFLLLGKESISPRYFADVDLAEALQKQLTEMAVLFARQGSSYHLSVDDAATVHAPSSFIAIVLNNVIKNAFSYSIGDIAIKVEQHTLTITNRHDGNETYNAGYGVGLVIVERICERMGWSYEPHDNGVEFRTTLVFEAKEESR
ncbi:HAMP domain-containing histidine kinase [Shewanella sp. 1CM18E]|uniref:sensor histidine kinase n=1 Tax=Shewanella sp. 1CM18E TaxID=2929169 RepID=UPI0020BDDDCC|nr:HAMP domain-containing sensor histidine kinase [Shewanella sp. 1CM18E]MCK8046182.1 HAMP domain-containing histidine kinase [Shewanella sp. 1CM18E]